MKKTPTSDNSASKEELCALLNATGKPLKFEAILQHFGFGKSEKKAVKKSLQELEQEGRAMRLTGGLWTAPAYVKTLTGAIQFLPGGALKFVSDNGEEEISISREQAGDAWDQDQVRIVLLPGHAEPRGRVLNILKRAQPEVAARFMRREGKNLICRSIGRRVPVFFTVHLDSKNSSLKFKPGQLLTVKPGKPLPDGDWTATLVQSYSNENALATQEALVKLNHNVPETFPELALEQAASLPDKPSESDYANREDLRHLNFVTIDGADARDFDDAIEVERVKNGWILRVAIADVSYYVQPNELPDSLDAEALRRGNSWYFPKSVEPMLPKKLSNGLCSLNPDVERLAMLAEIHFSEEGNVIATKFAPIVMRSKARLVYEQVGDFFRGNKAAVPQAVAPMLEEAYKLYKTLLNKRHERGSLDFDLPEPAYLFDDKGALEDIRHADRNDAHRLIEEFMIAANEAVASYLEKRQINLPFRVHPVPDGMKLASLLETLKKIAPEILPRDISEPDLAQPETIQKILENAKGTPSEFVVNRLCLRSMTQARYQTDNVGHFALASPSYCHFTSPIRRYADLLAHRALKISLGLAAKETLPEREKLEDISENLNKLERNAIDCEREMAKRLACLFLAKKEGAIFNGSISGVTDFGLFVELKELPAEGIIKIRELGADWFELDSQRQMLVGRNSGKTYQLGQSVKVKIIGIDEDRMEVRLTLAENKASLPKKSSGKPRSFENEKRKGAKKFQQGRKGQIKFPSGKAKSGKFFKTGKTDN